MAKKRSVKSYLMLAKYHNKRQEASDKMMSNGKRSQVDAGGQDDVGAQAGDERTPMATNESIHTANSISGDLSSGYHSVPSGRANEGGQFYQATCRVEQQPSRRQQSASEPRRPSQMVNERISGEKSGVAAAHMWPMMIDDEHANPNETTQQQQLQHIGATCNNNNNNNNSSSSSGGGGNSNNKVHLIDDDDDEDYEQADVELDVDVDVDSYDIDCVAATASCEDNNNISDRFYRHRYCVDSRSSLASRFDESFQLERQRHQQRLEQANANLAHHRLHQQYFHQADAVSNYYQQQQQQRLSSDPHNSSQFQPNYKQQASSLLNGVGSSAKISQQQRPFVNYIKQPAAGVLQYPIAPPTNYSQQQYHTLIQYQPIVQQPYSYTGRKLTSSADSSGPERSSGASDSSTRQHHRQPQPHSAHTNPNSNQHLTSLTPSGQVATKMQPSGSRQYLTAANDVHHQHHSHHHHQQQHQQQPQQPHKSSSRRKVQPSAGGQARSDNNHVSSASSSSNKSRATLDCCGKLAKFFLFTTNLLFWSAGIALGAWGILSLVEDHKYSLSQLLIFEPSSRMSLFQLLSWSFITLGCATILVAFCGCSAIIKNNRWILGLYIFLVLAIFALDLATGLLAIIFQEKLVANVRLRLANKLRADYGVQASFTAAIDYIQTKFECCGLEGHFDYDQSVWRLQRLGGFEATVSRTCCHLRNTFDDQAHINPRPVNESMCQSTDVRFHQSYRYRRGCLDDLERLVRHKIWTFTLGCAAVGGVILISLMFATCFCRSIQNYSSSRKGSLLSLSSPKHLDTGNPSKSARYFATPTGHQVSSSQRHHHHHHHQQHK